MNDSDNQEPSVGIFWLFGDEVIIDATPLSKGEPYGSAMTHPTSHIDHWTRLQRRRVVPVDIEYEQPPRGRVVFDGRKQQFSLLADRCILERRDVVSELMKAMHLPADKTTEGRDEHYRCFGCLFPADNDEEF